MKIPRLVQASFAVVLAQFEPAFPQITVYIRKNELASLRRVHYLKYRDNDNMDFEALNVQMINYNNICRQPSNITKLISR